MELPDRLVSRFRRLRGTEVTDDAGDADVDLERRRVLRAAAVGGLGLGGAKAVDNVLVGYGPLVGENLHTQSLASVASEGLFAGERTVDVDGHQLSMVKGIITVSADEERRERFRVAKTTPAEAADLDTELGLSSGPLERVVRDLRELQSGVAPFAFGDLAETFERARAAEPRPLTTALLRGGSHGVAASLVGEFTGADPTEPEAVIRGLVGAFREKTDYDVPRYLAGAVQFNLAMDTVALREPFADDVDWASLTDGEPTGLFCNEYAKRSVEALHAADSRVQTPPVAGALVYDTRHRHVYTMAASVVREDGELVVPATFLDYMHSTLYGDGRLTGLLGEGLEAYDRRHRATEVGWRH
ncbi:hypothetical protein N0B31_02220 [Salinirubellus salinus]|uniref:Uncharacterized protein n=1 Tax=Salinirubellus salinus TaxID=1364945 RepID=A0A9E7R410_9EURY|nr:hypothetical protein [Salinirubellus salinus]UWM55106.1 hypothetical protein N0B31_02220 [Salinirubellus salinus]